MGASVDGRHDVFVSELLPDNGEAGVQVDQAARWERGATGHKLDKRFSLIGRHGAQDVHKTLVTRAEQERE